MSKVPKKNKKSQGWDKVNPSQNVGGRVFAIVLTIVCGAFLFRSFTEAAWEGMLWKQTSDMAQVAPDFEERDPSKAKKVPDFTLKDRFGNQVQLSQFASADLLLINLWSSGCPACKQEIPSLSEMDRKLMELGRVALITITIDDEWKDVASYFPQGTDLRVLFDPENKIVKGLFGTTKFPETFILDKERRIRARFDGARNWHSPVMFEYVATYM
jgi:cytochrome c biogenesis protein CcmG/thiol:disulfide interchange protein DsbE